MLHAAAAASGIGVLLITFANEAQADFALNWLAHVTKLGLRESALVGATDATIARQLVASRAPCFPLESSIGTTEAKWGSPGFSQMGRTKAALARTLLLSNITFLFADVDVVFLADPRPFVRTQLAAGAQLLFHTDNFGASPAAISSGSLEDPAFGFALEVGVRAMCTLGSCAR